MTEGLLGLLGDPDWFVRYAAARALAGREAPGVTEGLVGLLGDPDWFVRRAAAEALAGREAPQVLLILAREIPRLSQSDDLLVAVEVAERLMIQNYKRIGSSEQMEVRAAMAWLTATALMQDSA